MPLSQFGVAIAQGLTDYFVEQNLTPLDLSDSLDMAQQAIGTMANMITSSYSYFLSRPGPSSASSPLSRLGRTPPQYQSNGNIAEGKAGLKRAIELADLFDIVSDPENLSYALSNHALIGGVNSRRSELISSAFNIVDTGNRLKNKIVQEDCQHIIRFIDQRDKFFPSPASDRILEIIKDTFEITPFMVEQEERSLRQAANPIVDEDGFEVINKAGDPEVLWKPEEALFKIIKEAAMNLRENLQDEFLSPVSMRSQHSSTSTPLSYDRSSSSLNSLRS